MPQAPMLNEQRKKDEAGGKNHRQMVSCRAMMGFLEKYHGVTTTITTLQRHFTLRHHDET